MKTKAEILSAISDGLPPDFDTAEDPLFKLHFLMEATIKVLENNCKLNGDFLLIDGNKTLSELLTQN